LPGKDADAAVVALTSGSDPKTRIAAIGAVGQRRITAAVPALLKAQAMPKPAWPVPVSSARANSPAWPRIRGMVDAMLKTQAVPAAESR
jgi:hypothetical protein